MLNLGLNYSLSALPLPRPPQGASPLVRAQAGRGVDYISSIRKLPSFLYIVVRLSKTLCSFFYGNLTIL